MGFIRGGTVVILTVVLFLSLFLTNSFLTLSWSLEYETLQPAIMESADKILENLGIDKLLDENIGVMQVYCQIYPSFPFEAEGYSFEIPCDVILTGSQSIVNYGIEQIVYTTYYQEYNCDFWDCIKTTSQPFVLVSEKAKNYWNSKANIFILISIILAVLLFFVSKSKQTALIIAGILTVFAALPFRKLDWILSFFPDSSFLSFFSVFFTRSYNVFLVMLIIGLVIFAVGISLGFFKVGFKFSKLFKKKGEKGEAPLTKGTEKSKDKFTKEEVKEIVKEVVKKEKSKQNLRKNVKDIVKKELDKDK
ncbi:hypothetical protein HOD29_04065 [archaeon]|jgi:hypothetical protein|nr:hypothetical protein [archaeon]